MSILLPALATLSEAEAARSLGISKSTLQRERRLGRIRFVRISARIIRYTEQGLVDYLASRVEEAPGADPISLPAAPAVTAGRRGQGGPAGQPTALGEAVNHELAKRLLGVRVPRQES